MEGLFMQVFERWDWVTAQMREQVDSHAQSLACSLLAAGHRPPPWLLPSCAGGPQELNGKPIVSELVFPARQITTPATNRTVFQPPAVPSTFFRKMGVPNGYTHLETICAAVDTNQHSEPRQKQTSVVQELAEASAGFSMFSRIQRSRSRQRNIEDRLREKDQAANSGNGDGMQDRMQSSTIATAGSNRTTSSLSSKPCGDGANNAGTMSSLPGQENDFYANKDRPTEFLKCSKDDDLGNRVHLDCSQSLVIENQIVSSDNNGKVPNNCSVRNLLRVQIAHSVCHPLPETHLLVQPKKLQFDGVETVCMNPASEQTTQQPKCALENVNLDLAGAHPLNEDPSSTRCSQVPRSMGRSLPDGVESGYLNLDSAPVQQHQDCALERASLDLTGMHSRNEDPSSLISPSEAPKSMTGPLLEKDTQCISETNSLKGPCSKVSPPLEKKKLSSVETNCFERSYCAVNPLLQRDTLHTVEDTERIRKLDDFSDQIVTRNSKSVEEQCPDSHVLHPPYSGSLQLPTHSSGAPASSGIFPDRLLEEDGCDDLSHKQLPPQIVTSGEVYPPNLSSYKTQSNDTYFNGCRVANASVSAENKLSQEQYLLARPSLEFNGNFADVDTPVGHSPLNTENETLNGKPASDAVNNHSGKLGDVQVKFAALTEACDVSVRNKKNESVVPGVMSNISARRTGVMHGTERNSMISAEKCTGSLQQDGTEQKTSLYEDAVQINANSCTTENNKQMKSSQHSVRYFLRSSVSHEKFNLLQSDGNRVASDQKRSVADGVQVHGGLSSKRRRITYQSDIALSRSSRTNNVPINHLKGDESVDCDDTMPEFESFDVPVQFDSPTIGERTFEALYDSRQVVTSSHQLLATMSGKPTNCSFPDDVRQYSASNDSSTMDIFGASGLGLDGSFLIAEVVASCSSNASNRQENIENPLTPSVEKYSLGKLLAKAGSDSEHMGSIPELACFRIDEDSSIADENEYQEVLPGSVDADYSQQWASDRKALQDITRLCQNTGNSASLSTRFMDTGKIDLTAETCDSEFNHHSNIRNDYDSKKSKENCATSVKREGKVSHSLHDRLSSTEILDNKNERHRSEANLDKRSKPSNVVANVTSFLPLVKPNLQPTTAFVQKDFRVKSLEVAEAAKRLEEKKRSEREMRKAAAKLERERLKQEKELKQKQEEEQKKKREANVATRKRQREKKEKEQKRKCIDEARKQQKQPMDGKHAANNEKDARQKASDNKEPRTNLVDVGKFQAKPDETTKAAFGYKVNKSNDEKDVAGDERPASFGPHAKESIPNSLEESYKMSPYKDSDEEDDDDFEHEQESRRRKKLIPLWSRKENLDKILLSNQTLDPRGIFAQKCSFNLCDVLSAHIPQRGLR